MSQNIQVKACFKDPFDVVVVFVFECPTNSLGHIKTGPHGLTRQTGALLVQRIYLCLVSYNKRPMAFL